MSGLGSWENISYYSTLYNDKLYILFTENEDYLENKEFNPNRGVTNSEKVYLTVAEKGKVISQKELFSIKEAGMPFQAIYTQDLEDGRLLLYFNKYHKKEYRTSILNLN